MRSVLQSLGAECGLACVAMILSHHGVDVELAELRRLSPPSANGMKVRQFIEVSAHYGLTGRAVRVDLKQLRELSGPAILHWGFNHFVVLEKVSKRGAAILDPACGRRWVTSEELSDHFTGVAIEFRATSPLTPARRLLKVSLFDFWSSERGLAPAVAALALLSFAIQFLLLAAPLALAALIDESVKHQSPGLSLLFAGAMVGLGVMSAVGEALRRSSLANLGAGLNAQINLNLMRHMFRLDFTFFLSRRLNDLLSRVESTRAIRDALTEETLPAIVDGVFAVTTAIIVFYISPLAAGIMLATTSAYLAVKHLTFRAAQERARRTIEALAAERASLTDTLRGVATVKLLNGESSRVNAWCGANLRALQATQTQKQLTAMLAAARSGFGACDLALVALAGVLMVMNGLLSFGGLMALLVYRQQFQERALALVDRVHELRMLGVHFERLSDIVQAQPSASTEDLLSEPICVTDGAISCVELSYRHEGETEQLLHDTSFDVLPGEFLAISGRSGGGKTTLLRVLTGLLAPTGGEIRIDGQRLTMANAASLREQIGAVLQDDQLFTGTIQENISGWDVPVDEARVVECAQLACIDDDVRRLPMGYHTLLGDMGSTLSAGQRQRLFIARALYRRPRLIFLDEGTANLDPALEVAVLQNLRAQDATLVCVAHRPGAIALADRVLTLVGGALQPVGARHEPTMAAE